MNYQMPMESPMMESPMMNLSEPSSSSSGMGKIIAAAVVGLLIGVVIGGVAYYFYQSSSSSSSSPSSSDSSASCPAPTPCPACATCSPADTPCPACAPTPCPAPATPDPIRGAYSYTCGSGGPTGSLVVLPDPTTPNNYIIYNPTSTGGFTTADTNPCPTLSLDPNITPSCKIAQLNGNQVQIITNQTPACTWTQNLKF